MANPLTITVLTLATLGLISGGLAWGTVRATELMSSSGRWFLSILNPLVFAASFVLLTRCSDALVEKRTAIFCYCMRAWFGTLFGCFLFAARSLGVLLAALPNNSLLLTGEFFPVKGFVIHAALGAILNSLVGAFRDSRMRGRQFAGSVISCSRPARRT